MLSQSLAIGGFEVLLQQTDPGADVLLILYLQKAYPHMREHGEQRNTRA